MGSGLLYDIFLSENYLGIYAIVFLLTAVSINYMYEKLIDFNKDIVNSLKLQGSNATSIHTKEKNIIITHTYK